MAEIKRDIFHFRADGEMAKEVKQIAEENRMSHSDVCRDAVSFYLSTGIGRVYADKGAGF